MPSPLPATDLRRVLAVFVNIFLVVDERVADRLFRIRFPALRSPLSFILADTAPRAMPFAALTKIELRRAVISEIDHRDF